MNILVLLAGIADPNERLGETHLAALSAGTEPAGATLRLSPFDEAALEQALQLRDRQPGTRIGVVLVATEAGQKLAQAVAAFRPDRIHRLDMPSGRLWDPRVATPQFRALLADAALPPDLVLIGREFGDADNSTLPPYIAETCGWAFVGQAHAIRFETGGLRVTRTRGGNVEEIDVAPPVLVSMVNDRGIRLRHPLLKNVMLSRREAVPVLPVGADDARPGDLRLDGAVLTPPVSRGAACRYLEGTVAQQAEALAVELASLARRR
jgi:electron transfer flavoprotein beta subunit